MTDPRPAAVAAVGRVTANALVSSAYYRLDCELDLPFTFLPGQFVMLNLPRPEGWTFSRPFSVLSSRGATVSVLYRVVGRGTAALAAQSVGARLDVLGPLGEPFPAPAPGGRVVLLGGGVGLPPVFAWRERWGRPVDRAFFGARDGGEVPWELLGDGWQVSVDRRDGLPPGREAFTGVVTALAAAELGQDHGRDGGVTVLACGPTALLRAAAAWARARGWDCRVSLEEHMGCGYGVCKGCVVSVRDGDGVRNATCCGEGPVFAAERLPGLDAPREAGA